MDEGVATAHERAEYLRLAEIAARHWSRHRELIEEWLADPLRDRNLFDRAMDEGRLFDRAMDDVTAFFEQVVLRPRLS